MIFLNQDELNELMSEKNKNEAAAKQQFEKAISLDPDYAQAHHNLGIINEMIGLPDDALNHYQKAVTINPRFAEAHRNLSKLKDSDQDKIKKIVAMLKAEKKSKK